MMSKSQQVSKVVLPCPHYGQRAIRRQSRRFNWLSAGRRWRKTTMAMAIVVEAALTTNGNYIWGAPTFSQVRIGFDETRKALGSVGHFNQSRMEASLPSGSKIIYRSLDNPDNARGFTANGVVIDECSVVREEAWREVLRPMLIDTDGWAWGIGTPKGRNWFWVEWNNALSDEDAMCWQVPTLGVSVTNEGLKRDSHPLENPDIPFSEIEHLHKTLPEAVFRQEILAEFIEDAGTVFRNIMACATAIAKPAEMGHEYIVGIDWGKHNDFTVFTVLDVTGDVPTMVHIDRFNQIDYQVQIGRLLPLYETYRPYTIIAEQNSIGEPLIEQLQRQGLPIQPFQTTNASKANAIDALALAFERQEIAILNHPVLVGELQAYEMERLPSGSFRYNAPVGMHDDTVMSLALAYHGATNVMPAAGEVIETDINIYKSDRKSRSSLWR